MIYVLYHYATNFMVSADVLVVSEPTAIIPIIWSKVIPAFFAIEETYRSDVANSSELVAAINVLFYMVANHILLVTSKAVFYILYKNLCY